MATYVISDIHGLKERYDAVINYLQEDDILYVLGDVIDRGKCGIAILLDIMERDNVYMLLGNHEAMMIDYYDALHDESCDEAWRYQVMKRWSYNHNEATKADFELLDEYEQERILKYLKELPIVCLLEVNRQKYYLVHGYYLKIADKQGFLYKEDIEALGYDIYDFIWKRVDDGLEVDDERKVIFGHTPTMYFQNKYPYEIWTNKQTIEESQLIDIDCGCAINSKFTKLALFCLDDCSVKYF